MGINLQVVMPYQKCVYSCPFCCARGKKHNYQFDNLYKTDYKEWQQKLIARCKKGDIDRVVITGEADPTQNYRFIEAVCETVPKEIPIDLTTLSVISLAALLVNVIANMLYGLIPFSIRFAILFVNTLVFPEPAPAKTSIGPSI